MANILVCTYEYEIDLEKIFSNRLQRKDCSICFTASPNKRGLKIECAEEELPILGALLAEIMLLDLRYIEINKMVNSFGVAESSKHEVVCSSCGSAARLTNFPAASEQITRYLKNRTTLVLEGFLHFMMQDYVQIWHSCVDAAIDEVLLRDEYLELVRLLKVFISLPSEENVGVNLILQPDGSCTLTDSNDLRVDCAPGNEKDMLEFITGITPERITVYDLSMGLFNEFKSELRKAFGERVEVFS